MSSLKLPLIYLANTTDPWYRIQLTEILRNPISESITLPVSDIRNTDTKEPSLFHTEDTASNSS